jgi:uncharacterized protein
MDCVLPVTLKKVYYSSKMFSAPNADVVQLPRQYRRAMVWTAVLAVWLLIVRVASSAFNWHLPSKVQDLVTLMTSVLIEALPFVILGILLSIVVQVWVPDGWLARMLPKTGWLRRMYISFLGVFFPVCECGNVPLARGLMVRGFTVGESMTFLMAAPILNPITIITTQQAFPNDPGILYARIIAAFAIANIIGWLYSRHRRPTDLLDPKFAATCQQHGQDHEHSRPAKSFRLFNREANNILPALFVGAFLAALIQTVVPRSILFDIGSDPVWSIAAMMLLAFMISICSNVDAFFALAFSNSFTAGSLVSFLVFGPMIDIKMLNLMKTTFKPIVLVQLTVIVALLSAIAGLVVQYAF